MLNDDDNGVLIMIRVYQSVGQSVGLLRLLMVMMIKACTLDQRRGNRCKLVYASAIINTGIHYICISLTTVIIL